MLQSKELTCSKKNGNIIYKQKCFLFIYHAQNVLKEKKNAMDKFANGPMKNQKLP